VKKTLFIFLLSFTTLFATTKTIYNGWNLVGTSSVVDLNRTFGNYPDISLIWGYDSLNQNWFGWSSLQTRKEALISNNYSVAEKIQATDGFWVFNEGAEKEVELLGTSLEKLIVGKKFFYVCFGEVSSISFTESTMVINDNYWNRVMEFNVSIDQNSFTQYTSSGDKVWRVEVENSEYLKLNHLYNFYDEQTAKDFPHYCGTVEDNNDTNYIKVTNNSFVYDFYSTDFTKVGQTTRSNENGSVVVNYVEAVLESGEKFELSYCAVESGNNLCTSDDSKIVFTDQNGTTFGGNGGSFSTRSYNQYTTGDFSYHDGQTINPQGEFKINFLAEVE
jgi:uncharacterized protein (DUF2249 family)